MIIIIIMIIAAVIRTYHMRDLAVFLADQASDSTAVFNILKGDFTLLGPITSVGGFYNGPIVYYLMAPIFWIFKSNPLSGTIFQTLIFCFTIPFIYFIGKKVWNVETGLLAGFIFAISPLMVEYSRAAFNSFPAIFFSTLIIYLLISLQKPFSNIKLLMIGVFIGWILQMHYFTVAFVLLVSIYPLFRRELFSWKYYLFTMFGIGIGFAPFLLFEIRHQFLNTHRMIEYFITAPDDTIRSLNNIFMIWPRVMGEIIGNNNIF
ncbi:MAG: Dolichyl-phosphate-mannose-protein mannosyltransferase, partial [Candidatus Roizmanbacteria bacterium GW2011_GWA2_37_7]